MVDQNKEVLQIGVDAKGAISDFDKFERALTAGLKEVANAVASMGQKNEEVSRQAVEDTELWTDSVDDLKDAYKSEGHEITKLEKLIVALHKKTAKANAAELKQLNQQIQQLKKMRSEKVKNLKARAGNDQKFSRGAEDLRSEMKDAFSSFFGKDFKRASESGLKSLVKSLKMGGPLAEKMRYKGMDLQQKGTVKGGVRGGVMNAAGTALKGAGAAGAKLNDLFASLEKMGPILAMAGTAIVGLVKLFLDLDAKAKAFNKDILASAGSADVLARSGDDAEVAFSNMSDTLREMRDASYDLSNITWGISSDEHKAILNVLNQEGVSISRIKEEADLAGKSVKEFQLDLAHVSVAYSRAFGVPLQEINQLQAEMMTEMSANLQGTTVAFQQMERAADESGIKANKFFSMIRGVSADLSLWGTRMEDAVKLLGRLGKVMNPREAQKFMNVAVQGLKNMGRTERLRATLLAGGGATKGIVDRDYKRKADSLAEQLNMSGDELIKKMNEKGPKGLEDAVSQLPKEAQGAMRSALQDMNLQNKRRNKGTFGMSTAARNVGPGGALEIMQKAILRLTGKGKLSDAAGDIGGEMMAENLGISEEQLDQMIKFESTIDAQRDDLKKLLESGTEQEKEDARKALKKAGLYAKTDEELKKKIDGAGYDQIMDTLDADTKKTLEGAAKTEDWAKKQADLQTSMLDKLGMLVDFIMNKLYDVMIDIWDAVTSLTVFGGDKKGLDLKKAVLEVRDPEQSRLLKEVGGDIYKFRGEMMKQGSPFSKNLADALHGKDKDKAEEAIQSQFFKMTDADRTKSLTSAARAAGVSEDKVKNLGGPWDGSLTGQLDKQGITGEQRAALMHQLVGQLDPALLPKLISKMGGGSSTQSAAVHPTTPGVSTPSAPTPASKTMETNSSDSLALSKDQAETMQSIDNQMDRFKMDTGFLSGPYSKAVESSVLAAVRTALFEYYMYKDLNQTDVAAAIGGLGMTGRSFSQNIGETAGQGYGGDIALRVMSNKLPGHAGGGMVTGIANGMAVTAAAGEGLASVGKGERIVPAGKGGGGNLTFNINGVGGADLAKVIEAKVIDGIYEYKRRERFT